MKCLENCKYNYLFQCINIILIIFSDMLFKIVSPDGISKKLIDANTIEDIIRSAMQKFSLPNDEYVVNF